jgi:hypothetical protein
MGSSVANATSPIISFYAQWIRERYFKNKQTIEPCANNTMGLARQSRTNRRRDGFQTVALLWWPSIIKGTILWTLVRLHSSNNL